MTFRSSPQTSRRNSTIRPKSERFSAVAVPPRFGVGRSLPAVLPLSGPEPALPLGAALPALASLPVPARAAARRSRRAAAEIGLGDWESVVDGTSRHYY